MNLRQAYDGWSQQEQNRERIMAAEMGRIVPEPTADDDDNDLDIDPVIRIAPTSETSDDADPLAGIDFDDPKEVADALMEQSARIMNDKPNEETSMEQKKPRGKAPKPKSRRQVVTIGRK